MQQIMQFAENHWPLCVALLVMLVIIAIHEGLALRKREKELTTAAAVALINHEKAVVVDIRDAKAFLTGHIIDAINVLPDALNDARMTKYKNTPLIIVCARGLQSTSLAATLRQQGFSKPLSLAGGISAWTAAGLPLVKGK